MSCGTIAGILPEGLLLFAVVLAGFLVMLGRTRAAFIALVLALLLPVLAPALESVLPGGSAWLRFLLPIVLGLVLLRGFASILLGKRAADHMAGILAADLVRWGFKILFFPVRAVPRVFRSLSAIGR